MKLLGGTQGPDRTAPSAGLTLIEVTISLVVATVMLLGTAAAFSENIQTVDQAERLADGALFLETTLESLSAVPYSDLLALDGNQVFDGETFARSNFTVNVTVFAAEVGLLQISAALIDRRTNRQIGRAHALRCAG
ncbi:MAG: hypothetical protein O2816_02630 [Planctomycetota bacterium]|nr:hypothetical protein [Planctomycetota bacterium]